MNKNCGGIFDWWNCHHMTTSCDLWNCGKVHFNCLVIVVCFSISRKNETILLIEFQWTTIIYHSRLSFPSGHASFALYSSTYVMVSYAVLFSNYSRSVSWLAPFVFLWQNRPGPFFITYPRPFSFSWSTAKIMIIGYCEHPGFPIMYGSRYNHPV
jgi:hypothetical protein